MRLEKCLGMGIRENTVVLFLPCLVPTCDSIHVAFHSLNVFFVTCFCCFLGGKSMVMPL